MPKSYDYPDSLYAVLRGMIREEIDRTPGFRELTSCSELPASIDAEKAILGSIMLDNTVNLAEIEEGDFALDSHRRIFGAMNALMEAGNPVDIVTLKDRMGEHVKEIGGVAYLACLTEGLPRLPRVSVYIAIVKEKANLRRIWEGCEAAIKECKEQSHTSAEIVKQLGVALRGIRRKASTTPA
jgi:replicative DNA helicase